MIGLTGSLTKKISNRFNFGCWEEIRNLKIGAFYTTFEGNKCSKIKIVVSRTVVDLGRGRS